MLVEALSVAGRGRPSQKRPVREASSYSLPAGNEYREKSSPKTDENLVQIVFTCLALEGPLGHFAQSTIDCSQSLHILNIWVNIWFCPNPAAGPLMTGRHPADQMALSKNKNAHFQVSLGAGLMAACVFCSVAGSATRTDWPDVRSLPRKVSVRACSGSGRKATALQGEQAWFSAQLSISRRHCFYACLGSLGLVLPGQVRQGPAPQLLTQHVPLTIMTLDVSTLLALSGSKD